MKTKLLVIGLFFSILSNTLFAQSGNMWSLTRNGGAYNSGSIVSMDPSTGVCTVKHSFMPPDGYHPWGNLLQANDGNLYGTCFDGGQFASCTLFRFEPGTNTYTDVYDFDIVHGDFPKSGLIQGQGTELYGVATAGGASYAGVLYSWDMATSMYSVIYNFVVATGSDPQGEPMIHSNGLIYGMTAHGGTGNEGVLYSFNTATATYTVLFDFDGINGATPYGSVIEASDGKLYGLTSAGGVNQAGVLFCYDPVAGTFSKKVDFSQSVGITPHGSLMEASNGLLYGMASAGGMNSYGSVFSYNRITNTITNIYSCTVVNGYGPIGDLYQSGNYLYGTAFYGGLVSNGTAFRIEIPNNTFTKLVDFTGQANGGNPTGAFIMYTPTGLPSIAENEIQIFPNPVSTKLNIQLPEHIQSNIRFTIYDLSGKLVMQNQELRSNNGLVELEVLLLKSGTYVVQLESEGGSYQQKFVKY